MPSFADSVWISIAIRFEATITQRSVKPNFEPPAMFVAKLPGIHVGDAGDEGRAEERAAAEASARVAAQHALAGAQGPVERFGSRADHAEKFSLA